MFVHTSALEEISGGIVGQRVMSKIIEDKSRAEGAYRANSAKREADYLEEQARERASEAAAAAVKASEEANRRARATQAAVDAASDAAMRATWLRPPGLARDLARDLGTENPFKAFTESTPEEQKIESVAKAEPFVGSMERSESSDKDATRRPRARAKARTRTRI